MKKFVQEKYMKELYRSIHPYSKHSTSLLLLTNVRIYVNKHVCIFVYIQKAYNKNVCAQEHACKFVNIQKTYCKHLIN